MKLVGEQGFQLFVRKSSRRCIWAADPPSTQGALRQHVGARCAAEAEVDAPGIERGERPELLRDDVGGVVGQHDSACTHANGRRAARHVADDHAGGCTGDAGHAVVLGEPVAMEAERLGMAREVERVAERAAGIAAFDDGCEVEDRERDHPIIMALGSRASPGSQRP